MKPLVIILLQFCICFVAVGQQYGSSRPANNRKYIPPPPPKKSSEENYNYALYYFNKKKCEIASGYLSQVNVSDFSDPQTIQSLRDKIKRCLNGGAETDDAFQFNPASDDLKPLPFDPSYKQIGYENVQFGNESFNNQKYADALRFYLRYLEDNFKQLSLNGDLFNQFEEKIEYCSRMLGF